MALRHRAPVMCALSPSFQPSPTVTMRAAVPPHPIWTHGRPGRPERSVFLDVLGSLGEARAWILQSALAARARSLAALHHT
ncbi:hypothetical protein K491DRAFT_686899 [Lophiostoma macrostomum CBS 122681]|uniref:Uncharacterized protein n=1 Tax=Lophiostoma macrostomum CBS 122681 TaxID=1314788 RepID=A0A6A6TSP0_9PLEO|nr:hypothetical protein K491DRAFT_686899 [Lophiostoma macrostomum CBS 122681]